jgi:hypothetical protein
MLKKTTRQSQRSRSSKQKFTHVEHTQSVVIAPHVHTDHIHSTQSIMDATIEQLIRRKLHIDAVTSERIEREHALASNNREAAGAQVEVSQADVLEEFNRIQATRQPTDDMATAVAKHCAASAARIRGMIQSVDAGRS